MKRLPVISILRDLRHDLRYAVRAFATQRLFTAVAVVMLALGIGANSAMFALVDAILLRPLPFPDPDRLVMVWERDATSSRGPVSPGNLPDWNERTSAFRGIAGFIPNIGNMVLASDDGTAETIPRQWVSSGIFDVLGVQPVAGRTFRPSDDSERANVVSACSPTPSNSASVISASDAPSAPRRATCSASLRAMARGWLRSAW